MFPLGRCQNHGEVIGAQQSSRDETLWTEVTTPSSFPPTSGQSIISLFSEINRVSLFEQTLKSTNAMAQAMKGATKVRIT